jgi:multiple sugar transport system substrate-binding protein
MRFALLLCLIFCSLYGPAAAQTPPRVVHMWHAMRGARAAVLERLTQKFEASHPGIHIELKAVLDTTNHMGNDYAALYRGLLEALAQHKQPEVAQFFENWVAQLEEVHALVPLDNVMGTLRDDLIPVFQRSVQSPDGKMYSVPFNKTLWVLYINKTLFDKFGLKPPQTWDELRATSLTIQQKSGLPGLVFQPGVDAFGDYLLSQGGQFIDTQGKPDFGGPIGQASLDFWSALTLTDHSAFPTIKALPIFAAGNAGMLIDTTSKLPLLDTQTSLHYATAPMPLGKKRVSQLAGTNLGIFQATDPGLRQAAVDYIQYMTSPAASIEFAEASGYLPVRRSSLSNPGFKAFLAAHPNYAVGVEGLDYAVVQPRVAGWESIRGLIDDAFFASLSRQSTAREALQKASELATDLLSHLKGN